MAKESIYTGGGRLYFAKQNADGSFEPLRYFARTDGITMTTSVDFKEQNDTESCTPVLAARYPSKKAASIKFTTPDVTIETLGWAFQANLLPQTQSAAAGTTVNVSGTGVKQGYIVDVGYYNATNVVVKDSGGATTYTEGTDYTFDSKAGFLTIIEGGAIADGTDLDVTLDVPEVKYSIAAALKQSELLGRFEVVTSSQTGNNYRYIFKRVSVTMSGDFNVKSPDDIATLEFEGAAMVDTTTVSGTLSDYIDIIELQSNEC